MKRSRPISRGSTGTSTGSISSVASRSSAQTNCSNNNHSNSRSRPTPKKGPTTANQPSQNSNPSGKGQVKKNGGGHPNSGSGRGQTRIPAVVSFPAPKEPKSPLLSSSSKLPPMPRISDNNNNYYCTPSPKNCPTPQPEKPEGQPRSMPGPPSSQPPRSPTTSPLSAPPTPPDLLSFIQDTMKTVEKRATSAVTPIPEEDDQLLDDNDNFISRVIREAEGSRCGSMSRPGTGTGTGTGPGSRPATGSLSDCDSIGLAIAQRPDTPVDGLLTSIICDAADGNLMSHTLSNIIGAIDNIVQEVHFAHTETLGDVQEVEESQDDDEDDIEDQDEDDLNDNEDDLISNYCHRPQLTFLKYVFQRLKPNSRDRSRPSRSRPRHPEPIEPLDSLEAYLILLEKRVIKRVFSYLPLSKKRTLRLVCRTWRSILDEHHLQFHVHLNRSTIVNTFNRKWDGYDKEKDETEDEPSYLDREKRADDLNCNVNVDVNAHVRHNFRWKRPTQADTLVVYDVLDVPPEALKKLPILYDSVKELQIESSRQSDYQRTIDFENATIGETNLVEMLKLCRQVERLVFHNGSIANFGLELLEVKKDENSNRIVVGWKWPEIKVQDKVSAVSAFLSRILGDLDQALYSPDLGEYDQQEQEDERNRRTTLNPADPPLLDVQYKEATDPPFSAFVSLVNVHLDKLRELSLTVTPTKSTERMGTIALLHVQNFPALRSFTISVQEYLPDEALYRAVFKFIVRHQTTLRYLTFINPVLSTKINTSPMLFHIKGLEQVRLRELTVAWEFPLGLDVYWSNGHFLLETQRRLKKLEFHTTNVVKAESVICNNFRHLTDVHLDIRDTNEPCFDCSCFSLCARLSTLCIHVAINVAMKNVGKIPDTVRNLHWDCMYRREDVQWFSRFLILAKTIYFYHDKQVPMDLFTPLNFSDFLHFISLPCIEQLCLPRIHVQDPRVNRFCERNIPGLKQERDLFFIDRDTFHLPKDVNPSILSCT